MSLNYCLFCTVYIDFEVLRILYRRLLEQLQCIDMMVGTTEELHLLSISPSSGVRAVPNVLCMPIGGVMLMFVGIWSVTATHSMDTGTGAGRACDHIDYSLISTLINNFLTRSELLLSDTR